MQKKIPRLKRRKAESLKEALVIANQLGYPLTLEKGDVRLKVLNERELKESFGKDEVMLEEYPVGSKELILVSDGKVKLLFEKLDPMGIQRDEGWMVTPAQTVEKKFSSLLSEKGALHLALHPKSGELHLIEKRDSEFPEELFEKRAGLLIPGPGKSFARGENFSKVLQEAMRLYFPGSSGIVDAPVVIENTAQEIQERGPHRLFAIFTFFEECGTLEQAKELSGMDLFFLKEIEALAKLTTKIEKGPLTAKLEEEALSAGFSARCLEKLCS